MGRGNDGTAGQCRSGPEGHQMGRIGRRHYPLGTLQKRNRKRADVTDNRADEQKLEDGLTKMMKSRTKAQAYIARKKRKESK